MGRLFQSLLFYLAACTEHELRYQIQFFKAENEMRQERVPKQRIFLRRQERERLVKLGTAIGPGARHQVTIVRSRTYQRWTRSKKSGRIGKNMGRPKTLESVREIVVRIAKEIGRGYGRILGELRKLWNHSISESTTKNILKEDGSEGLHIDYVTRDRDGKHVTEP